jgi:hypothetical protein
VVKSPQEQDAKFAAPIGVQWRHHMPTKQQHSHGYWRLVNSAPADAIVVAFEYFGDVERSALELSGARIPPFAFAGEMARMLRLPPTIVKQIAALQQKRHAAVRAPGSVSASDAIDFIRQVERLASRF